MIPWSLPSSGTQVLVCLAVLVLIAPAASAQEIAVTASLDVTDGWARVGAYVPVTLAVTNNTDRAVAEVLVSTGGPLDMQFPWALGPGESDGWLGQRIPVFYTGGDILLDVVFFDAEGAALGRTRTQVADVRPVPEDTVVLWLRDDAPKPDTGDREALLRWFGGRRVHVMQRRLDSQPTAAGGMVDAVGAPSDSGDGLALAPILPPVSGARAMVQPEAYALLESDGRGPDNKLRLWLGLAVFAAAVLAVSVVAGRRRLWLVVGLLVLAAGATAGVWLTGGRGEASLREWSLRFGHCAEKVAYEERWWMLESRGSSRGFCWDGFLPMPVFASAEAAFRPFGVIFCGHMRGNRDPNPLFKARRPRCLLHAFRKDSGVRDEFVIDGSIEKPPPDLDRFGDVVAALVVRADRGTDANGKTQPLDAWAVAWKESGDPDLAWAGRTLAWWDAHRRSGDGPFLVAWFREPVPKPPPGIDTYERLPAMVVYSE